VILSTKKENGQLRLSVFFYPTETLYVQLAYKLAFTKTTGNEKEYGENGQGHTYPCSVNHDGIDLHGTGA
jgi:hypothetical protein